MQRHKANSVPLTGARMSLGVLMNVMSISTEISLNVSFGSDSLYKWPLVLILPSYVSFLILL